MKKKNSLKKNGRTSSLNFWVKTGVLFVFVASLILGLRAEDLSTVSPIHASAHQEVKVSKNDSDYTTPSNVYLSARLSKVSGSTVEDEQDKKPIGGSVNPVFATVHDGAFLTQNFVEVPEDPPKERNSVIKYTVKPNDTPSNIARSFDLKLNTVLWANHLASSEYIHPGDELLIPPTDGVLYEIKQGDTLSSIASRHESGVNKILEANDIQTAEHVFAGQTIIVPDGVKPSSTQTERRSTSSPSSPSSPRQYASSRQNLDSYFIKPTSGYISQHLHGNNAIDLADGCWKPIYAAAAGTVGKAVGNGWWNGGYGNYVTINHPNGTRTLYAHMAPGGVEVSSGTYVSQGQLIGYTHSTGLSTGCHLHWEVHGARNPLAY